MSFYSADDITMLTSTSAPSKPLGDSSSSIGGNDLKGMNVYGVAKIQESLTGYCNSVRELVNSIKDVNKPMLDEANSILLNKQVDKLTSINNDYLDAFKPFSDKLDYVKSEYEKYNQKATEYLKNGNHTTLEGSGISMPFGVTSDGKISETGTGITNNAVNNAKLAKLNEGNPVGNVSAESYEREVARQKEEEYNSSLTNSSTIKDENSLNQEKAERFAQEKEREAENEYAVNSMPEEVVDSSTSSVSIIDDSVAPKTGMTTDEINEYYASIAYQKYGTGNDRKKALEAMGLDYYAIQDKINEKYGVAPTTKPEGYQAVEYQTKTQKFNEGNPVGNAEAEAYQREQARIASQSVQNKENTRNKELAKFNEGNPVGNAEAEAYQRELVRQKEEGLKKMEVNQDVNLNTNEEATNKSNMSGEDLVNAYQESDDFVNYANEDQASRESNITELTPS